MNRKQIDGSLGSMALVIACMLAAFYSKPALQRLGFDDSSMVNKIAAGTVIAGSVLAICALISFVAWRIIQRKDK
jgi:hypothetical protein